MSPPYTPHVALLIDTSMGWGQRLIRGVINYAHQHGPWLLWVEPNTLEPEIHVPAGWQGHGIIARVASHSMARHIEGTGLPCVNISSIHLEGVTFPQVMADFRALARMAAEHLFDRGFRNFAYCGPQQRSLVQYHYDGFAEALRAAGCTCTPYRPGPKLTRRSASWVAQQNDLIAWVKSLPKPVAVLTWFVQHGRDVISACRQAGVLVPEEVAVLASDDDPLLCDACLPPLSGIASSSELVGYQAAAMLDRLMRGEQPTKTPVLVEPAMIVSRQSTETLAIDDRHLAQAVAFIRSHAGEPIQVKDVLACVPFSRRQLEQEFRRVLGRSPAQEIRRAHLERAKRLLAETDLSIPHVADASGFNSPEHFSQTFKAHFGHSPLRYRTSLRGR
jgi:LacI family transcriptional regulator